MKVTRLKLVAVDDEERLFLAALKEAILNNQPITLGNNVWLRCPAEQSK